MSSLNSCFPGQPGGCEWTLGFLWNWLVPLARLDVVVLALLFCYLFVVLIHVTRRSSLVRVSSNPNVIATLNAEIASLKAISFIAPYLGLAGTCVGILDGTRGVAMEIHAAIAALTISTILALIPTIVSIPVAVLATCFYNHLLPRVESLYGSQQRPRRFPLRKRFSELPPFAVLAAPVLALSVAGFMSFASFKVSRGYAVDLAPVRCGYDGDARIIVLHIREGGKLYINYEEENWLSLPEHLAAIYGAREYRTLYLLADPEVTFQAVANAIDVVKSAPAHISVQLITPKTFSANCPTFTVIRRRK